METYDYREAIVNDIKQCMLDEGEELYPALDESRQDYFDRMDDYLWGEDRVTGNGPNFYDTEEECYKYLCGNLSLYFDAAYEFDSFPHPGSPWIYKNPAQYMDCTIRCYLLYECLDRVIDEIWNKEDE